MRERTVWSEFADRSAAHGQKAAVLDGPAEVSYEALRERAEAVAAQVQCRGVAPGSLVGVCLGRSWELVASLLGVLRAGCAYVPMDPGYPEERLRYMVDHSGMSAVIADDVTSRALPPVPDVVRVDGISHGPATTVGATPPVADDVAYVIYTSGSTGAPKGVTVEHRSVVAMASSMGALLDDDELSGVLAATSVCFDPSVMEILGTLMLGGTVVLAENALTARDVPSAARVRTAIIVPSVMTSLLRAGGPPNELRCVVFGGETLTCSLVEEVRALPCSPRVVNVYGPTEATVFATAALVDEAQDPIPIGAPVTGCRAYVLDEALRPVPDGAVGELFLAGAHLARGYLHDEVRTRRAFPLVPEHSTVPERRLYRTGDRCRRSETGELLFVGRADRQVKVRGHRIELDEIETVLASMDGVDEVVVEAQTQGGKDLLVAYIAGKGTAVGPDAARGFLLERLPRYMLPHVVLPVPEMPRLPNGKVDRRALPEVRGREPVGPGLDALTHPIVENEPHETRRSVLLGIVRREVDLLVGASEPGQTPTDESLDTLGLDSLDLAELTQRISDALGTQLASTTLDEQMTAEEVVAALLRRPDAPDTPADSVAAGGDVPAARLETFQAQIQGGHPPAFAAKIPAWSATDKAALVQQFRDVLARSGLDPYGKVVRTGSAERGTVADLRTGAERDAVIWTTNLYLGLNRDEAVIAQAREALSRFGTGMGISAAGSGQTDLHLQFEEEFAAMVGKPAACLFPTGYTASLGAISGVVGDGDVVVMDQLAHASLVDGAHLSGASIRTFRHNDVDDLRRVLSAVASPYRTCLVVVESVYSMGEGQAPLREIVEVARRHGALLVVDEAHSFGLYGEHGAGLCAAEGVTDQVDFVLTTLSKAMGSVGGVVAAQERHIELLRTSARPYVFQANTTPADIAAALAALRRVRSSETLRERVWSTARYLRRRLEAEGYELGGGDGLIVTPHVADGDELRAICLGLFERGVHTAAVAYPIVEKGRGRLRFICSASHTRDDVDRTVHALREACDEASARRAQHGDRPDLAPGIGSDGRAPVEDWVAGLVAGLEGAVATGPTVPDLGIVIRLPGHGDDVGLRVEGRQVTATAADPDVLPACILRPLDDEGVSALCSGDVSALLESVLAGRILLEGRTQPFVWLIGRLSDSQAVSGRSSGSTRRSSAAAGWWGSSPTPPR